jgi:hypothetical protein
MAHQPQLQGRVHVADVADRRRLPHNGQEYHGALLRCSTGSTTAPLLPLRWWVQKQQGLEMDVSQAPSICFTFPLDPDSDIAQPSLLGRCYGWPSSEHPAFAGPSSRGHEVASMVSRRAHWAALALWQEKIITLAHSSRTTQHC